MPFVPEQNRVRPRVDLTGKKKQKIMRYRGIIINECNGIVCRAERQRAAATLKVIIIVVAIARERPSKKKTQKKSYAVSSSRRQDTRFPRTDDTVTDARRFGGRKKVVF